jgi:hypothetical protein
MVFFKFMNSLRFLLPVVAVTLLPFSAQAQEANLQSEPFGYVKITIPAGTGTSKTTTLVSIPLLEEADIQGSATGRITAVGSNTITAAGVGWTPGQLSTAAAPHLVEITSGSLRGRMFLISSATANTADTVTVDPVETAQVSDLRNMQINAGAESGDTFKIRPVDTLSSFFGTPESSLIQGGSSAASADTVTLVVNGNATTYFYNTATTPRRWSRVAFGNPDASHTPLLPYAGLQYGRLGATPLQFIVTGRVPSGQRQVGIKNSGPTILSPYWPVSQTLAGLALQNVPQWKTGSSAATADTVVVAATGGTSTFFHDGTNWRRVAFGNPLANTNTVPVGASLLLNRKGAAGGYSDYVQNAPYNIQ